MRGNFRLAIVPSIVLLASGCNKPAKRETPAAPAPLQPNAELPSGKLDRRNLIEFTMAARSYKPKDEFSQQSFNDAPLVGRTFRVVVDMADPQNADLPKLFSYDAAQQILQFSLQPGPIYILGKASKMPAETRSNAFGTTVQVTRQELERFAVGPIRMPYDYYNQREKPREIGVFIIEEQRENNLEGTKYAYTNTTYSFSELKKSIPLSPEKARDVSRDLHLVVEGIVTKDDSGHSVECSRFMHSAATISSPFETVFNECTVSARFTRIQIVSPKMGTLAEWQ